MNNFHWGWRIAIVYTVFAASTLGFVAFAFTNRVDLVREDYYEESLRQDDIAAARERARTANATITLSGTALSVMPGTATDGAIEIRFYRADEPSLDRTVSATVANGTATVDCSKLRAGRWTVTCLWSSGGRAYRLERPITVG